MGHSTSCPTSYYHHRINLIVPGIFSSPVHSSYMVRQATCDAMVSCIHCTYSLIGNGPVVSSASATGGHPHLPLVVHHGVIPVILPDTQWWNTSSTLRMALVTIKSSLPYNNTDCRTVLYSIPSDCTVALVFETTITTIDHRRYALQRFWYRSVQSLLLYATVSPRYKKSATGSRGSEFTLIKCDLIVFGFG